MEFIVTEVEGSVDDLEWLKIDVHFLFFAIFCEYSACVEYKAVGGDFGVEFEALLRGCDGAEDRLTVDSGFDVGSCAIFCLEHTSCLGDLYVVNRCLGGLG